MYYEAMVNHLTSNPYSLRSVCLCVTHVLAAEIVSGLSFSSFSSSSSSPTADAAAIMAADATADAAITTTAAVVAADKDNTIKEQLLCSCSFLSRCFHKLMFHQGQIKYFKIAVRLVICLILIPVLNIS